MLFFKTLYSRHFYACVHEIHTAYNFIFCHYMHEISYNLNDIFIYQFKAKQLSTFCAFLLLMGVHTKQLSSHFALSNGYDFCKTCLTLVPIVN